MVLNAAPSEATVSSAANSLRALADLGPMREPQETTASTGGAPVYAVGDIHGCYNLLKSLLAKIAEDQAGAGFARRPQLVFLGDYVDRGPDAARVIEALRWIKASPRFDACMLMGNHEQGMLQFIQACGDARGWLRWGGKETLLSYGVCPPGHDAPIQDLEQARRELLQNMPASHLEFLMGLELMTMVGDYAFVHAGIRPDVPLEAQQASDMLWIRDEFINADGRFDKVIVHGHTWLNEHPQTPGNRIGVDTGAYETGVLTAVRLHNHEVRFLRACGPR